MDSTAIHLFSLLASRSWRLRGRSVLLDLDLAAFYEVEIRALHRAVRRNAERFPEDLVWVLTQEERVAVSRAGPEVEGGRRRPSALAFSLPGSAMLASVLQSPQAIAVHIALIRSFVGGPRLPATREDQHPSVQAILETLRQWRGPQSQIAPKRGFPRGASTTLIH
jgi:hypothetical protein